MKSSTKHFFTIFFFALVFFTLTVCANAANERESNDNINSANSISVNETVYAQLTSYKSSGYYGASYSDDDFYKVTLSSDGYINITINHDYYDSNNTLVELVIFDANNNTVYNKAQIKYNMETCTTMNIGLSAGTYYVHFDGANLSGAYDYSFKINFIPHSYWEKEPNSNIKAPNDIQVNHTYYGYLDTKDIDVYKFSIKQSGTVCLTINHDYYDSNSDIGTVKIYTYNGSQKNELYDVSIKLNAKTSNTLKLGLPADDYYFEFKTYETYAKRPYNFKINYTATNDWEILPNNTLANATDIQAGKTYHGAFNGSDKDYYSFILENSATVKVIFNHSYADSTSTFANIEIMSYDGSSETLLNEFSSKCNNQTTSSSVSLPADQYYIVISEASAENAEYNFMIEYTTNAVVSPDSTGVSNKENEAESNTPTHTNHDESITPNNGIADIEINHEEQSNTTTRRNGNSNNNNKSTVEIPISAIVALVAVVIIAAGGAVIFLIIKKQKNN